MFSGDDKYYMSLALTLAEKGRGTVSPNPLVGAVVVKNGVVVGKGYHKKAGEDHAEIIALKEAGEKALGATLYVTLEPCCHHGKTPPCTDSVIKYGIARVVAAMEDDNPKVCGNGLKTLCNCGIVSETGLLEKEARKQNEVFLRYITRKTPFLSLKLAVTLDGRTADEHGNSKWITGPESRCMVHQLRAWNDAVMVGVGTVLADDPMLDVRDVIGNAPRKVVVDSTLKTPLNAKVLTGGKTIVAVTERADTGKIKEFERLGVEIVVVKSDGNGHVSLPELLKKLGEKEITSVLCEGGSTIASSLIKERLADKVFFGIAPKILGSGKSALENLGIGNIGGCITLGDVEIKTFGDDILLSGYPEYK